MYDCPESLVAYLFATIFVWGQFLLGIGFWPTKSFGVLSFLPLLFFDLFEFCLLVLDFAGKDSRRDCFSLLESWRSFSYVHQGRWYILYPFCWCPDWGAEEVQVRPISYHISGSVWLDPCICHGLLVATDAVSFIKLENIVLLNIRTCWTICGRYQFPYNH